MSFVARPVEYLFHRSGIFSVTVLLHGASPVEYRLDQDRVVRPKRYSTGRGLVYPIFSLSRQACPEPFLCQDKLRRRDAKTAKKKIPISSNLAPFAPLRELSFIRSSPYLWTVFFYHVAHEDHEEFTIKYIGPCVSNPVFDIT